MAEYDGISQFRKVAPRRLADARELLESPTWQSTSAGAGVRHLRSSMYLAGYAVECILKAYIIDRQHPAQRLAEAVQALQATGKQIPNIMGVEGHRLQVLLSITDLASHMDTDQQIKMYWSICLKWKSTWRYDPLPPSREDASNFVLAAERVYDWVNHRL